MNNPAPRIPLPQAVAACVGFAAFAVSVFAGLRAGNPVDTILGRALGAMAAAFVGGFAVGLVADWLVREEIRRGEDDAADDDSLLGGDPSAFAAQQAVDLEGLTGVDILEEDEGPFASEAVESENRSAVGARREKSAA